MKDDVRGRWSGAYTVATCRVDPVHVECGKCGRHGRYSRKSLASKFGAHASMPDVLHKIAGCPRSGSWSDPCGAFYARPLDGEATYRGERKDEGGPAGQRR